MQVFLPYHDFEKSVQTLDTVRLNKQLLECRQMLSAMAGQSKFGAHHPSTKMWIGYHQLLLDYIFEAVGELTKRGTPTEKNFDAAVKFYLMLGPEIRPFLYPEWYRDGQTFLKISMTHRASLYKKNPEHYAQFAGESSEVDLDPGAWMCCPVGTHAVYYYPTHVKES